MMLTLSRPLARLSLAALLAIPFLMTLSAAEPKASADWPLFRGNAVQNGLLTAIVSDDEAATLMGLVREKPGQALAVDLEQQTIECGDRSFHFVIDPVRRTRLLNGWDNIALTENYIDQIAAFKMADRARRPWAAPAKPE